MAKARASNQLAFAFDLPKAARHPAAMAGSDARTARMVGEILNSDPRAREVIAAEMSVLLDDQVSKAMLAAWSAPGKDAHHISWSRLRALSLATNRLALLDRALRQIGAAVPVGQANH